MPSWSLGLSLGLAEHIRTRKSQCQNPHVLVERVYRHDDLLAMLVDRMSMS